MTQICDFYSEDNYSRSLSLTGKYDLEFGQTFTGKDGILNSSKFYIAKNGSPLGLCYSKIYNITGNYGEGNPTGAVPTGSALAISEPIDVSTLSTSLSLVTFLFKTTNKIKLVDGNYYAVCISYEGNEDYSNSWIKVGIDDDSPTHSGNWFGKFDFGTPYYEPSSADTCFYVYTGEETISPFPSFRRP